MRRLLCVVMVLAAWSLDVNAQTAGGTTHTVGPGDTLYGIVAEYYPERMARWTDVAVDIVALNPDEFPQGLDTVMRLGDELIIVDYSSPDDDAASNTRARPTRTTESPKRPRNTTGGTYSAPGANLDSVKAPVTTQTVDLSGQPDIAPTAINNSTAATTVDSNMTAMQDGNGAAEPGQARMAIGYITLIESRALATDHQNQQRSLTLNNRVFFGDAVSTDEDSRVSIRMIDEAEFHLQPGSRLMFERYRYSADTQRGSAIMTLVKGGFRATSGLLGQHQPDAIAVNTAVATVGIRGTEFALRVCARDTCRANSSSPALKPGLYSGVLEGSIVLSNNTGDLETRRGEFYHVAAPNRVPEVAPDAASLLFSKQELAMLDVEVEEEQPLSFLGWLKQKLFGQ